ncbi:hypothetical protein EKD04_009440 [Chloroflexales bacterium ZM16-3]|nr:hypothetical protein [Chloroflexales bacterium ZM16-3]
MPGHNGGFNPHRDKNGEFTEAGNVGGAGRSRAGGPAAWVALPKSDMNARIRQAAGRVSDADAWKQSGGNGSRDAMDELMISVKRDAPRFGTPWTPADYARGDAYRAALGAEKTKLAAMSPADVTAFLAGKSTERVSLVLSQAGYVGHVRAAATAELAARTAEALKASGDLPLAKGVRLGYPADMAAAGANPPSYYAIQPAAKAVFGRPVSASELAGLAGVGPGRAATARGQDGKTLHVAGDGYGIIYSAPAAGVSRDRAKMTGEIHMEFPDSLRGTTPPPLRSDPAGWLGGAQTMRTLGVSGVKPAATAEMTKAQSVWYAESGFDGPLPKGARQALPPELASARRVSDLMLTPAGQQFWRDNAEPYVPSFDPSETGKSVQALKALAGGA